MKKFAELTPDAFTILAAMRGDEVGEGLGSSDWDIGELAAVTVSVPSHLEGMARRFAVRCSLEPTRLSFADV